MTEPSPPLGPTPRRPFETTPVPTPSHSASPPATPSRTRSDSFPADSEVTERQGGSRNRSVLNLTASTLFGIYSPSGYESTREGPSTPWGTGALTPSRPPTIDEGRPIAFPALTAFSRPHASSLVLPTSRFGIRNHVIPFTLRTGLLFAFGIAYGIVVAHLHDNQQLAPVKVENIDRSSWRYMILWGVAGVFLGRLLPLVDVFWEEASLDPAEMASVSISAKSDASTTSPLVGGSRRDGSPETDGKTWMGADWNPAVRSIGAFIGIAFAIVRNPLNSPLPLLSSPITDERFFSPPKAQTPLAINTTSLSHPRPSQPLPMVSNRSLQTGIFSLLLRRNRRHDRTAANQSGHGTFAACPFAPRIF